MMPFARVCVDCGDQKWCSQQKAIERCQKCRLAYRAVLNAEVDEVAVDRLIHGPPPARTTPAEKREAVRILDGQGLSALAIAERMNVNQRTVERHLKQIRVSDYA